jgi:hypothetical protein
MGGIGAVALFGDADFMMSTQCVYQSERELDVKLKQGELR